MRTGTDVPSRQIRAVARWALSRWRWVAATTLANLIALSVWTTWGGDEVLRQLAVAEVLAAGLLAHLTLLWATLLVEPEQRPPFWRRLGRTPLSVQALVASTVVGTWLLAAMLLVDGVRGIATQAWLG